MQPTLTEKVHARCKSDDICETNDALTLEELARHHGMASKLGLIHDPSSDESKTN